MESFDDDDDVVVVIAQEEEPRQKYEDEYDDERGVAASSSPKMATSTGVINRSRDKTLAPPYSEILSLRPIF